MAVTVPDRGGSAHPLARIMSAVDILRLVLRYAHLIGFAALLGAAVAQYVSGKLRINQVMVWAALAQLVTGLALAAPLGRDEDDMPHPAKLGVKLVLAIMIFVMVFFSRRRESVNRGHFSAIIGLLLVTVGVATFWQ